jgi:TolB-like protein
MGVTYKAVDVALEVVAQIAAGLTAIQKKQGSHVRVSTELVDARNGNTIWADSYDRNLTDIFAIQSEMLPPSLRVEKHIGNEAFTDQVALDCDSCSCHRMR